MSTGSYDSRQPAFVGRRFSVYGNVLAFVILSLFVPSAQAQSKPPQPSPQVHEHAGNAVVLDDSFEYAIIDYGVGQIQVRAGNDSKSFSPDVFWVKFRVLNKSDHLIQRPRHIASSLNALRVVDNWGNTYWLRRPEAADVGSNWQDASLPVADWDKSRQTYKPGESSWDLRIIHIRDFIDGITELHLYLEHQFNSGKNYYFRIVKPMERRTDLLQDQPERDSSQLQVTIVTEVIPAPKRRLSR